MNSLHALTYHFRRPLEFENIKGWKHQKEAIRETVSLAGGFFRDFGRHIYIELEHPDWMTVQVSDDLQCRLISQLGTIPEELRSIIGEKLTRVALEKFLQKSGYKGRYISTNSTTELMKSELRVPIHDEKSKHYAWAKPNISKGGYAHLVSTQCDGYITSGDACHKCNAAYEKMRSQKQRLHVIISTLIVLIIMYTEIITNCKK